MNNSWADEKQRRKERSEKERGIADKSPKMREAEGKKV